MDKVTLKVYIIVPDAEIVAVKIELINHIEFTRHFAHFARLAPLMRSVSSKSCIYA